MGVWGRALFLHDGRVSAPAVGLTQPRWARPELLRGSRDLVLHFHGLESRGMCLARQHKDHLGVDGIGAAGPRGVLGIKRPRARQIHACECEMNHRRRERVRGLGERRCGSGSRRDPRCGRKLNFAPSLLVGRHVVASWCESRHCAWRWLGSGVEDERPVDSAAGGERRV